MLAKLGRIGRELVRMGGGGAEGFASKHKAGTPLISL